METNYTYEINQDTNNEDFDNIIRINNGYEDESDEQDYDLDYDPNEMYFALLNDSDNNY